MKKLFLPALLCVSFALLPGATVWEGAAAVAMNGELPDRGLYIATNSFPANSYVNITNLENGKTIRVVSAGALDSPGILALLSRDAAAAIDLMPRSLTQISMAQPADTLTPDGLLDARGRSGDPDYDPALFVAMNGYGPLIQGSAEPVTEADAPGNYVPPPADDTAIIAEAAPRIPEAPAQNALQEPNRPAMPFAPPEPPAVLWDSNTRLSLVPAETRPPETIHGAYPDLAIPPSLQVPSSSPRPDYIDPAYVIPPVAAMTAPSAPVLYAPESFIPSPLPPEEACPEPVNPPQLNRIFPAPIINSLEKGMYYLQIAAYTREETVRSELLNLDPALPVAIMNSGTIESPVYRVLIGPVNQGESAALLQRFKASHKDAFLRIGS